MKQISIGVRKVRIKIDKRNHKKLDNFENLVGTAHLSLVTNASIKNC